MACTFEEIRALLLRGTKFDPRNVLNEPIAANASAARHARTSNPQETNYITAISKAAPQEAIARRRNAGIRSVKPPLPSDVPIDPKARARAAAVAERVFNTVELLKMILIEAGPEAMSVCQGVNRTFKATIDGSKKLKRSMKDWRKDFKKWDKRREKLHWKFGYLKEKCPRDDLCGACRAEWRIMVKKSGARRYARRKARSKAKRKRAMV